MQFRSLAALLFVVLLATSSSAFAQKLRDKTKPKNDPVQCPYCMGEPELMAASGIVSHGGFEFGKTDTAGVDKFLFADAIWIETAHFEIGFALGSQKVNQKEKKKLLAELTRLSEVLPEIKPKTKRLDPWLRAHLYAQRCEDLWRDFSKLLEVEDKDFPPPGPWMQQAKYMGQGPYLGQEGKFEVLILPSEAASLGYLKEQFGLLIKLTQRWNIIDRGSLALITHTGQGSLRVDEAMHGHVVFNLVINMLDGYKHYSYELPVWIREGLAHYFERNLNPNFNSFDSSEGAVADTTSKSNWEPPAKKLAKSDNAPRMASLMALKNFSGLELKHHYTTWSMVDFLEQQHPGFVAKLLDGIKGLVDEQGVDNGSPMPEVHRQVFKDELGMSYAQFDAAWRTWVAANYKSN